MKINLYTKQISLDIADPFIRKVEGDLGSTENNNLGDYSRPMLSKIIEFTYGHFFILDKGDHSSYLFYINDNVIIESEPWRCRIAFYKNLLCHRDDDSPAVLDYRHYATYYWCKNGYQYRNGDKPSVFSKTHKDCFWRHTKGNDGIHNENGVASFYSDRVEKQYRYYLHNEEHLKHNYFLVIL